MKLCSRLHARVRFPCCTHHLEDEGQSSTDAHWFAEAQLKILWNQTTTELRVRQDKQHKYQIQVNRDNKTASSYLISAGEPQPVQYWNENMGGNEEAQDVGAADEPVLSAVSVDFCRHPDDRHGGLEWGDERQRNGETFHAPVCHQELLCGALTAPWERVVQPNAQRGGEQDPKYHKVYNSEELLVGRVHPDCL